MCNCQGKTYNIAMCCEPQVVLGPVENYYTKPTIDRKLEEITSAITSGCCITPEEVDEKIEEAISGITVSGVTEEQLNEAIASAKTEIEAEIPTVPTSNTAFTNDAGYLTEHQSLSGYATTAFVSAFTYDKATIDEKVAGGGSFDPSQYYNKTATDALLDEKLDVTAYTPTDLSNYYTKTEVDNEIISAITDVEAEIPVVPTSNTAFTNDAGYITGVDLSNYATKDNLTAATDDMATKTWVGQQGYLTEHQSLTAYSTTQEVNTMINQSVSGKQDTLSAGTNITIVDNVISATGGGGATYTAGTGIDISGDIISTTLPITTGSGQYSVVITTSDSQYKPTASGLYSYAEGVYTKANGYSSHAEGDFTTATGSSAHAEGHSTKAYGTYSHAEGNNTTASGAYSHSEGNTTQAIGQNSHAEGYNTTASTDYSHAEGAYTKANASYSHVEGIGSQTNASYSHAEGYSTKTENVAEHASGQYNVSNKASATFGDSGNTLFSVGNGTGVNARNNAFEIRQNGDVYVTSGGTNIKLQDHLGGGSVTIDPTLDSGSTNPVANSAITEAVLVPSYRGLIEVQNDVAFPNATALYVEKTGSRDSCYITAYLSGESSVEDLIFIESFTAHTFEQEPSYVDYQWVDDALILTPKTSGNYFYKAEDVWGNLKISTIDNYSSGSSSSVIQNEIYPRIDEINNKLSTIKDIFTTEISFDPIYHDYGGYWRYDLIWKNNTGNTYTYYINKLRYNDFGYDNGVITVKKTSGVTSGSTDCLTSGGAYQALSEKPDVWCGTSSQWSQISGNTQPNTIYLVY